VRLAPGVLPLATSADKANEMNTHQCIGAAVLATILSGMPKVAAGQGPQASGAVSFVWSSRDEAIYVRMFPDLKAAPESETGLQLSNSFALREISPSSEGALVCEPEQSVTHQP
jgi:hypothetical protein